MDISIEPKAFDSYLKIFTGEKLCKLSADTVIPDTSDDISRLLTTEFKSKILSKDVNFGKITINGELEALSLFVPENGSTPECVFSTIPFTAEFTAENVDSSSVAVASITLVAADWRELNPRKIGVNADVFVEVSAYSRSEISIPCTQPESCDSAFFKSESRTITNISLISEKLASIEDEHEIQDADAILSSSSDCFYDSSELVGNRLIVKGHTHSRVIFRKKDGELSSLEYNTPFSQLFDHAENADIAECNCEILSAGEYYELNGTMLNMELRMVIQLICYENREITYISDAYSCGCGYELSTEDVGITYDRESIIKSQSIQLAYELTENSRKVFVSGVSTGKLTMSGNTVNVPIVINAISIGENSDAFSFRARGNAEFEDISCDKLSVNVGSVACTLIGNTAQFEISVVLKGNCSVSEKIAAVSAISVNVEVNKNISPSVIIARAESGDIWDIAKKYGADQNRITEMNGIGEAEDISGRMLLIPMT